jgi:hypothetical protein
MRGFIATGAFGLTLGLWVGIVQVGSQTFPRTPQESGPEDIIKQRENNWTVGVAGGNMDRTYLRFADELGKVLDDGDELRVLPTISRGAAANLQDLLYLPMSRSRNRMSLNTSAGSARRLTWKTASATSSASPPPNCTSRRERTSRHLRTCVVKRWCSARPEVRRR